MSLQLKKLVKTYPEFRLELDFSMKPGELLTLLGPSGCGKTTSLRLIAGFIEADSGHITMGERCLDPLPPHKREIGIVFQDYALFPNLNVQQNIAFGPRMQGWSATKIRQRVQSLLELVHLRGYEQRKVTELSGGEQQRVALARALAPQPKLLLLDEPLSALDAKMRKTLRGEIRRIQQELGITTLYITHDQEEALALSDRIAVMRRGRIEQMGTPEQVYATPGNVFVAQFIGQANLIPGTISHWKNGLAFVDTPLGILKAPRPEGIKPCSPVLLFFRPGHCLLAWQQGTGRYNRIQGRIAGVEYLGEYRQIHLAADTLSLVLNMNLEDSCSLVVGDRIEFGIEVERCRILGQADRE